MLKPDACIVNIVFAKGRYADAQTLVTEALALHQELGEQTRLAHSRAFAGYTARGLGQHDTAQHYFFQALESNNVDDGFLTLLFVLPGIPPTFASDAGSPRSEPASATGPHPQIETGRPIVRPPVPWLLYDHSFA